MGVMGGRRTRSAFRFAVLCAVLALGAWLLTAGPAFALTFNGETPAPGAVLVGTPAAISVSVANSSALSANRTVIIDGVPYSASFTYASGTSGHWVKSEAWDDDAEEWVTTSVWVTDPDLTRGSVFAYCRPPVTADGTHTVTVTVATASGTPATDTWAFIVRTPPVLGSPAPAPDALVTTAYPDISIPASDNSYVASFTATINGAPAAATYDAAAKCLHVIPTAPLPNDAVTTVAVSVFDGVGARTDRTWSFRVQTYQDMPSQVPLCLSCHPGDDVDLNMGPDCANCHPNSHAGTPASVHVAADFASCRPCHVSDITIEHNRPGLTCQSCHASTAANVKAAIAGGSSQCASCHGDLTSGHLAAHNTSVTSVTLSGTTAVCGDCHDANLMTEHAKATSSSAAAGCAACHPALRSTIAVFDPTSCVQGGCHTTTSSAPMHSRMATAHTPKAANAYCLAAGCHAQGDLAAIHSTAATGCLTCHKAGTLPASADCASCHGDANHLTQHDETAEVPAKCDECHSRNLVTEHVTNRSLTCATCHKSGDGAVTSAIASGDGVCSACHGADHALTSAFCYGCHASPTGSYPGQATVSTSKHSTTTNSTVAATSWPGSNLTAGACANCHTNHEQERASGDALCFGCHDAPGTTKPSGYSYQGQGAFQSSAHNGNGCESCHQVHGSSTGAGTQQLVNRTDAKCAQCHSSAGNSADSRSVTDAFQASGDSLSHHDVPAATGDAASSGLKCESCHNPHFASASNPLADPGTTSQAFDLQGSVPADSVNRTTDEMDLPIIADATLDSSRPNDNFGNETMLYVDDGRNVVLRVDDSLLPPDSYITSAELHVNAAPSDRFGEILPRILTEPDWTGWDEMGATWNDRRTGVRWADYLWGGGDETDWNQLVLGGEPGNSEYGPFSRAEVGDVPSDTNDVPLDVTVAMQAIYTRNIDPYTGIVLKANTPGAKLHFPSREAADPSVRPYVHVKFYRTSTLINAQSVNGDSGSGPGQTVAAYHGSSVPVTGFDLTSAFAGDQVPEGATITSVRLLVYGTPANMFNEGDLVVRNDDNGETITTLHADEYQRGAGDRWIAFDGKPLLEALRNGAGGFDIESDSENSLDFWGTGVPAYAPKLEIQWSTADPVAATDNSIEFCLKCHGDSVPAGITIPGVYWPGGYSYSSLAFQWENFNSHGEQFALGSSSRPTFDAGASLKDLYFYGMGPLQCTDCHDPHGSQSVFHLKTNVNGQDVPVITEADGSDTQDVEQWCAACHTLNDQHEWWGTDCLQCHQHGRSTGRRF